MLFKAALACEQAVFSRHKLASANHRDFLMELAFQVIYISLAEANLWRLKTACSQANAALKSIALLQKGYKNGQKHYFFFD